VRRTLRAQFGDIVGPRDTLLQLLKERAVMGAIRGAKWDAKWGFTAA